MSNERENEGAIWKNENKDTDRHPDFKGHAVIAGVEYWVSAWKRPADAQNERAPALKFKFSPKEQRQERKPAPPKSRGEMVDDDIPW